MFGHKHYVPILKTKAGERWALSNLAPGTWQHLTPVLEIHGHKTKAAADHLDDLHEDFQAFWPNGKTLFLDTIWLADEFGDPAIIQSTFDSARAWQLPAVPVVRLPFTAASRTAVAAAIQQDNRGCMLRLRPEELGQGANILALVASLGIAVSDCDLLIDFQSNDMAQLPAAINATPQLMTWRTVTTASGTFPSSISGLPHHQWNSLARADWLTWEQHLMHTPLQRKPTFGDFTIRDPGPPPEFGAPSANLRYAKAHDWRVIVGGKVNAGGSQDMNTFCAQLVGRPEYDGQNYSAGDAAIYRTSVPLSGPGNATQWVQWCMNHHLEFVASQIRNHPVI